MATETIKTFANGVLISERVIDVPPPTREEYGRAVEAHVDAIARSRGYANAAAMVTYETSTVPQFAAEAQAFKVWRDSVWIAVAGVEAAVLGGQRSPPSIPDLIAELPQIVWPAT